jgi:hypothetical protein
MGLRPGRERAEIPQGGSPRLAFRMGAPYDSGVLYRPSSFVEPCLPSTAEHPPTGADWVHEVKHDGYRLMARRDPVGVRLLTRNGHDWASRFPLILEAVNHLRFDRA